MKKKKGVWRLEYFEPLASEDPDEQNYQNDTSEE